ncbi:hypothetical protein KC325_g301 [Hortaea werneckii]|nr:hypothetical protein KC325_g301 [Hortaea werneckii]
MSLGHIESIQAIGCAGRLTLTFRSLQLRQPYLERRNDLGFRASLPSVVSLGFSMLAGRCLGKLRMVQKFDIACGFCRYGFVLMAPVSSSRIDLAGDQNPESVYTSKDKSYKV